METGDGIYLGDEASTAAFFSAGCPDWSREERALRLAISKSYTQLTRQPAIRSCGRLGGGGGGGVGCEC